MRTKLLILLFLASLSTYSQATLIPDINFENKLIELGIDTDGRNGKIVTTSINSITSLDISVSNISDLTGIQDFTALTSLDCKLNNLTSLNLSSNNKLGLLDCRGNKLTSLDLSKLPLLTAVACSENFLTSLDLSKNPVLTGVFCGKNNLLSLNVKNGNNTKFQNYFFDFRDNPLLNCIQVDNPTYSNANWADFKDNTTEYSNSCGPNYTMIPDSNFENKLISLGIDNDGKNGKVLTSSIIFLETLDVSNSAITDLTGLQNFLGLITLNVSNNQLTNLNLNSFPKIKNLDCNNNLIANLDLKENKLLEVLNFSNNRLSTIDLSFNSLLYSLKGASNTLTAISVYGLRALKTIEINGNQLSELNVSNNQLLTLIKCNNNLLTDLDVSQNSALISLFCSNNQLVNLDIRANQLLREISCENNILTILTLNNGKNNLFTTYDFRNNVDLTCIQVDDAAYATNNWTSNKDISANYNTICNSYTLIPDINFEKKLIALYIDSGIPDGKVSTKSVISLTSLDVSNSNISDLTGIQSFRLLKILNCSSNQLSNLDLSKNKKLTNLYCSTNKLANLDLTANLVLTNLNCSSNQFSNLDVLKNLALAYLDCSTNNLRSINISPLTALTDLDCSFNQITDLNISKNLELQFLVCSSNNLTNIDISTNVKLENINCSNNQLTSLDASNNVVLNSLNCSKNNISVLNLKNGKNNLFIYSNINFTTNAILACILVDDPANANLNWSYKKDPTANYDTTCKRYTLIPDDTFEKALISLGVDSGLVDGKVLTENIENLTSLNLYRKNIPDLTGIQDFTSLVELILTENKLTSLDVSKNINLQLLYCTQNKITNLDVSKNILLTYLTCSYNLLKELDISQNKNLYSLECNNNLLNSLDVSQNLLLWDLDCGSNNLNILDVSKNTQMGLLACYSNPITTIDLSKNVLLWKLGCANNQLTNLDVSQNILLEVLYCGANQLKSLDVSQNIKLRDLSCSNNLLTSIDVSKNMDLFVFQCDNNQINNLDVTKNTELYGLWCYENQLTTLDVSKNSSLGAINCSSNNLLSLNLRNTNNVNFDTMFMESVSRVDFKNNPNLSCIMVDNPTYSNANWASIKDITASFSATCGNPIILPSNNFIVESKGETCTYSNNGEINITATATYNYAALVNGQAYNFINNNLKLDNLAPGAYNVSITIQDEKFEQNYTVVIAKAATVTGKSSITANKVAIEITEGTAPYTVFLDGVEQFKTTESNFSLETKKGSLLQVKTAKACEGVFSKDILEIDGSVLAYPNPTTGSFEIELPTSKKEVAILLYTLDGHLISNKTCTIKNGKTQISLENQPTGAYIVKIELDTPNYLKIIKK